MAQVRALVREGVLGELFAGEELEIRVVDRALEYPFIRQPINMLEQQQPDHEAGLDPWPAVLAVERRDLAVDPVPIDLAGKQNQLVLRVDDLVQPRPEQIVRSRRLVLLRSHRPLRCTTESWSAAKGNPKTKLQASKAPNLESLQSKTAFARKTESPIKALRLLHGRLTRRFGSAYNCCLGLWVPDRRSLRSLVRDDGEIHILTSAGWSARWRVH